MRINLWCGVCAACVANWPFANSQDVIVFNQRYRNSTSGLVVTYASRRSEFRYAIINVIIHGGVSNDAKEDAKNFGEVISQLRREQKYEHRED